MGNSASDRHQEGCEETRREDSQSQQGRLFKSKRTGTQYPARPGEKQYEWEEPRVVKIISQLGGTTDGAERGVDPIANRVDRLRLLGNGVVPGTCERAIRILLEKIHD